jgi:hypothetical protein
MGSNFLSILGKQLRKAPSYGTLAGTEKLFVSAASGSDLTGTTTTQDIFDMGLETGLGVPTEDLQALDPSQKFVLFDDFEGTWAIGDAGPADRWVGGTGNGTGNQTMTTVAASLGGHITMKSASDDGAITANMTAMSAIGLAYKANQGGLVMETRLKLDAITAVYLFVGFSDTVASTLEEPIFLNAADIDSTATDACGILFDTDGTTSDLWLHGGVANGTDTTPAYATTAPTAPVADTFVTLRVEVSAAGAVQGFVNGNAIGAAVASAVTPTVALTPGIWLANRGAAQRIVTIDYIWVAQNR